MHPELRHGDGRLLDGRLLHWRLLDRRCHVLLPVHLIDLSPSLRRLRLFLLLRLLEGVLWGTAHWRVLGHGVLLMLLVVVLLLLMVMHLLLNLLLYLVLLLLRVLLLYLLLRLLLLMRLLLRLLMLLLLLLLLMLLYLVLLLLLLMLLLLGLFGNTPSIALLDFLVLFLLTRLPFLPLEIFVLDGVDRGDAHLHLRKVTDTFRL